ncbi:hypothetical protein L1887_56444 [Cichorium endivia]|nr:hypothetical protein L1887_56444 [Cichorium endivia]
MRQDSTVQRSGSYQEQGFAGLGWAGLPPRIHADPQQRVSERVPFHTLAAPSSVANLEQNSSALFSKGARRVPPQRRRRALVKMPNFQQNPTKRKYFRDWSRKGACLLFHPPNPPKQPPLLSRSTAGSLSNVMHCRIRRHSTSLQADCFYTASDSLAL